VNWKDEACSDLKLAKSPAYFLFTIYLISDFIAGMPGRFFVSVQESDSDDDFSSDLKNLILLCAHLFGIQFI